VFTQLLLALGMKLEWYAKIFRMGNRAQKYQFWHIVVSLHIAAKKKPAGSYRWVPIGRSSERATWLKSELTNGKSADRISASEASGMRLNGSSIFDCPLKMNISKAKVIQLKA